MFKNPENLKQWQDGFISKTLISGEEMQTGAVSEMMYKMGKRDMAIIETITNSNFPDSFEGRYEHTNTSNTMKSTFEDIDGHSCQYTAEIHYTRFTGFMVKLFLQPRFLFTFLAEFVRKNYFRDYFSVCGRNFGTQIILPPKISDDSVPICPRFKRGSGP